MTESFWQAVTVAPLLRHLIWGKVSLWQPWWVIGTLSFFFFFLRREGVGYIGFSIFQIPLGGRCYSISGFDLNFETIFIKDYSQGFHLTGYKEWCLLFVKLDYMRTVGKNTGVGTEKKLFDLLGNIQQSGLWKVIATQCYFKGIIHLEMKIQSLSFALTESLIINKTFLQLFLGELWLPTLTVLKLVAHNCSEADLQRGFLELKNWYAQFWPRSYKKKKRGGGINHSVSSFQDFIHSGKTGVQNSVKTKNPNI